MTRETRIGLVVGLGLIIMFGLVLGGLNEPWRTTPQPVAVPESTAWLFPVRPVERTSEVQSELAASTAGSGGTVEASLSQPPPRASDGVVEVSFADTPAPMPEPVAPVPAAVEMALRPAEAPAPAVVAAASPPSAPPAQIVTYAVQPNDSLYKIAAKFYGDGNKYRRLLAANKDKISDENVLPVGQVLVIPAAADRAPAVAQVAPASPARPAGIAQEQERYRTIELRELSQYFAKQGASAPVSPAPAAKAPAPAATVAKAPAPAAAKAPAAAAAKAREYVVGPGDNLSRIAKKLLKDDSRQAVQRLYAANKDRIRDPNVVSVGMKLVIPS